MSESDDEPDEIPWWLDKGLIEETFAILVAMRPTEILDLRRAAFVMDEYSGEDDFVFAFTLDFAFDLIKTHEPDLYWQTCMLGARDRNRLLQSNCVTQLGMRVLGAPDREVEQLLIDLLQDEDSPVREQSFDFMYRSLQLVPRPPQTVIELTQQISPFVRQLNNR